MSSWLFLPAWIAATTAVGWLLLCAYLYLNQLNLIFYPQPLNAPHLARINAHYPQLETLTLTTTDGLKVSGWLLNLAQKNPAPVVIFFGGNKEEASWIFAQAAYFQGYQLVAVNYRGYGTSQGSPSEQALFQDALTVFDAIKARPDVDANHIVLLGRSLGSGVATYLATQRPVAKVILITPYDSVAEIGQVHYPYAPVRWLIQHPFNSLLRAPQIHAPLLMFTAANDEVIPLSHSLRLLKAWAGEKQHQVIPETDHQTIVERPVLWETIRTALHE